MFDNTLPNVILLTDHTDPVFMQKVLGPSKVAHELRKVGYQVVVINHLHIFSIEELFYLLKTLISNKTLFVGISSLFYRDLENKSINDDGGTIYPFCKPGAMLPHGHGYNQDLKQLIKDSNPNCKLVLGGPNAMDAVWNKDYDYVVCGYADKSSVNLANHLSYNELLNKAFRSIYGFTVINDMKAEGFDISTSTMSYETYDGILPGESMPTEIARGCIFDCAFCSYPLNGKKKLDFIRSCEVLYNEFLENYKKHGIFRYIFSDDTFNDSIQKVQMISEIAKRLPFQLEFWAYIRLDLLGAHPETIDLLFDSGLRGCYFGVETWNKLTGEIVGKGLAKEKQLETLRYIKNKWGNKIMLHGSFIVGLPEETVETATETFNTLMSDDCPLDSWNIKGFDLENAAIKSNQFISRIGKDPAGFGYKIVGEQDHLLLWENSHMDWKKANELADNFNNNGIKSGRVKLNGLGSFNVANLGFDLAYSINCSVSEINWFEIYSKKQARIEEYKQKLYSELHVTPYTDCR